MKRAVEYRLWSTALWTLVVLAMSLPMRAPADACETWQRAHPLSVGNGLYDVEQGLGLWIAVGRGGTILTSPDAVSWTRRDSGTEQSLYQVVGNQDRAVIFGSDGLFLTSTDAVTWTVASAPFDWINEMVWTGSLFIAVGESDDGPDGIATSADGLSWTLALETQGWENDLAVMASGIVAVGGSSVLASSDGVVWQELADESYVAVATDGQKLVAAHLYHYLEWSDDGGATWNYGSLPDIHTYFSDLLWTGAEFLALGREYGTWANPPTIGDTRMFRSSDGSSWTELSVADDGLLFAGIGSGSSAIMVGEWGMVKTWSDGTGWVIAEPGRNTAMNAVASSGSTFVTVGSHGFVATSPDGLSWQDHVLPGAESLLDVIWVPETSERLAGSFLAVGWRGDPYTAVIATSSDGASWSVTEVEPDQRLFLSGVTATETGFVAVGWNVESHEFVSFVSSDGVSWSFHGTDYNNWFYVRVAGNGSVVLAVTEYQLLASSDGSTWLDVTPPQRRPADFYQDVAVDSAGNLVVVSQMDWESGLILKSSDDGGTWTTLVENLPMRPEAVAWIGDRFVAAGLSSYVNSYPARLGNPTGFVSFTLDGVLYWPDVSAVLGSYYSGVVASDSGLVGVSCSGTVVYATQVDSGQPPVISGSSLVNSGETVTLGAPSGYDSYLWSTGETTSSITVSPTEDTLYWVTLTSQDGCSPVSVTHRVSISPLLFSDGFESGDSGQWSSVVQ